MPLVEPSSCIVKGGIPSSRRSAPTYLRPGGYTPGRHCLCCYLPAACPFLFFLCTPFVALPSSLPPCALCSPPYLHFPPFFLGPITLFFFRSTPQLLPSPCPGFFPCPLGHFSPLQSLCGGFNGASTQAPTHYARTLLCFGQAHRFLVSCFCFFVLCCMYSCPFPLCTQFAVFASTHSGSSHLRMHFATSAFTLNAPSVPACLLLFVVIHVRMFFFCTVHPRATPGVLGTYACFGAPISYVRTCPRWAPALSSPLPLLAICRVCVEIALKLLSRTHTLCYVLGHAHMLLPPICTLCWAMHTCIFPLFITLFGCPLPSLFFSPTHLLLLPACCCVW